ncbi:SigE family RNA polymerase sigma factor [soil metagenome]
MAEVELEYAWFFRTEYEGVVRTARVVLGDAEAARDVAQEAFMQLYLHWKKVSRYDRPEAWVRRIALRLAPRTLRRERLRGALERRAQLPAPETVAGDDELLDAIKRLSPAQKAAVALFYYEDRPISEISTILECSEGTARVHLHKARRRLGQLLGEGALDVS